MIAIR